MYGEGIEGCSNEFVVYSLLYILFNCGNSRDLLLVMVRLIVEGRRDEVVKYVLVVWYVLVMGNYMLFFWLYRRVLVLSFCLMDIYVEKMWFEVVKCMIWFYCLIIFVVLVVWFLGFIVELGLEGEVEGVVEGVEECEEWLRGYGVYV